MQYTNFLVGAHRAGRGCSGEGPRVRPSAGGPAKPSLRHPRVYERCVAPRGGAAAPPCGFQGRCGQHSAAPPGRNAWGAETGTVAFRLSASRNALAVLTYAAGLPQGECRPAAMIGSIVWFAVCLSARNSGRCSIGVACARAAPGRGLRGTRTGQLLRRVDLERACLSATGRVVLSNMIDTSPIRRYPGTATYSHELILCVRSRLSRDV